MSAYLCSAYQIGRMAAYIIAGENASYVHYHADAINAATQGRYHAYILKANSAEGGKLGPHRHTGIDFQMVYILKGWLRFWFDGHGEILAEAGTCVLQPPGIAHEALEWSDDLELLEVTSPRHFETTALDETAAE